MKFFSSIQLLISRQIVTDHFQIYVHPSSPSQFRTLQSWMAQNWHINTAWYLFFFFGECNDKYSLVLNTHLLRFKLILSIFSLKNKGTNTTHQFHKSSQMRYYLFSTRTITYYQKYQIHTPKKRGGGHNRKLKEQPKVQGS